MLITSSFNLTHLNMSTFFFETLQLESLKIFLKNKDLCLPKSHRGKHKRYQSVNDCVNCEFPHFLSS